MPSFADLLFVTVTVLALPLLDHWVVMPRHRRLAVTAAPAARRWLWASAILSLWAMVAVGGLLWHRAGRSWAALGFSMPQGWRLYLALALCVLLVLQQVGGMVAALRDAGQRRALVGQIAPLAFMLPHTRGELGWFGLVSLTAGFCEEFFYRGYLIWAATPWLGGWGAAALSVPCFAAAHAYQGWQGVLRTGAFGAVLALLVALFGSLWPAIALHALIDLGVGVMAWCVLRGEPAGAPQPDHTPA